MNVSRISSSQNHYDYNPHQNVNFGVNLKLGESLAKKMQKNPLYRDTLNKFDGWLSAQSPEDGVLTIIEKIGKRVEQLVKKPGALPSDADYNMVVMMPENLELSMKNRSVGFCFREDGFHTNARILDDLKTTFNYLKHNLLHL